MIQYMPRAHAAGEKPRGKARGQTRRPQRNGGIPWKGGRGGNCHRWSAAGRGPPSPLIPPLTPREGGGRRRSAGGKPPDCVKARRAAAALALSLKVAALSSLFRDVLRLLQSGLVRMFLSDGGCRDVANGVMPYSGTGILLYAKKRREVLGRIGGRRAASPRRTGGNAGGGESRCP